MHRVPWLALLVGLPGAILLWWVVLKAGKDIPQENMVRTRPLQVRTPCPLLIEPGEASQSVYEETPHLDFVFRVTNRSADAVRVRRLLLACGCTSGHLSKYELAAGEETDLRITYGVRGLFGKLPKQKIRLLLEGIASPAECFVSGERRRRFRIQPPTVDLGTCVEGRPAPAKQVSVEVVGEDMVLEPDRAIANNPWIVAHVQYEESVSSERRVCLLVSIRPDTPQGEVQGSIFIPRKQDDGIGATIPVRATVQGPVVLEPPVAFLGLVTPGKSTRRIVCLKPACPTESTSLPSEVRLTGVITQPEWASVIVQEPTRAVVELALPASKLPAGALHGEVVLSYSADGTVGQVILPIRGVVVR